MKIILTITRRRGPEDKPYRQRFVYEYDDPAATVATALTALNDADNLCDETGTPCPPPAWQCSCLQKKCGACAMRINGHPMLACDARLKKLGKEATLEPLQKFPVVRDLIVDRQGIGKALTDIGAYLTSDAEGAGVSSDDAYDASRCLRCGLCLEACPNFEGGGRFIGAVGLTALTRLMRDSEGEERRRLMKLYRQGVYAGCGKSLACGAVCPAGIDTAGMLSRSNAIGVWRRVLKDMKDSSVYRH